MNSEPPNSPDRSLELFLSRTTNSEILYSKEDLEQWKEGVKHFQEFWKFLEISCRDQTITEFLKLPRDTNDSRVIHPLHYTGGTTKIRDTRQKKAVDFFKSAIHEIMALFLRERPAVYDENLITHSFGDYFERLGYRLFKERSDVQNQYIYNPELVNGLVLEHRALLHEIGINSTEDIIESLKKGKHYNILKGLILGMPLPSILQFQKSYSSRINRILERLENITSTDFEISSLNLSNFQLLAWPLRAYGNDLGIKQDEIPFLLNELRYIISGKPAGGYGLAWIDFEPSEESTRKKDRINTAFKVSGMQDILKELHGFKK